MAKYLADSLQGDLDVVLVHKIGAPNHPEFAIGSVSESGDLYRSESLSEMLLPRDYIEKQAQEEVTRLRARRTIYSPIRPPLSPKDRTVIIVDDGIATGSTILAAIRSLRGQNPKKLIVATPVASPRVLDRLKAEVDELVVLKTPLEFLSVGQFYDEFEYNAEYMDDLDEFFEENDLKDKVDMDKVMEIWNQYHSEEEEDQEDENV